MKINLENNSGYRWFSNKVVYAKGYLYNDKNELYADENLVEYFTPSEISFKDKLKHANGIFAAVVIEKDGVKIAVDRTRTFPLFYATKDSETSVFDKNENSSNGELNLLAVEEFRSSGFVSGKQTLLNNVFQVQAGEYVEITEDSIQSQFYFKYTVDASIRENSVDTDLSSIFDRAIQRVINYVGERKIVVPLSAGYDSRLLVALLKRHNYKNVLCFTYGRSNSYEVKTSKKIAEILEFDWTFVEYTDELIQGFSDDPVFKTFFYDSGSNLSSLAHIQDFFAVKELHKRGEITDDSVFLPGHSGDFLAGSHLHKNWTIKSSEKDILKAIFKQHYRLGSFRTIYADLKKKTIGNLQKGLAYSVFEDWDLKERQAKFIINSVRVYEQFDCKYALPLWDSEMIEFFKHLPLQQKLNTIFYDRFILEGIFKEFGVDMVKPRPSATSEILRKILPTKLKSFLKGLVSNKVDYNNFDAVNEEFGEPKGKYINTVLVNAYLKKIINGFQ